MRVPRFYLTVFVQPLPLSTLLPSDLRLPFAFGFRFSNDFAHDLHSAFVQWVEDVAIAGTPKLPRLIAVAFGECWPVGPLIGPT
jgi:hypothetical protein